MTSRLPKDINPGLGRIGVCTVGPARGQYILLLNESENEWDLYCSLPWDNFPGFENGGDLISAPEYLVEETLAENEIRWIPIDQDDDVERRIFDMRKDFHINHKPFWQRVKRLLGL